MNLTLRVTRLLWVSTLLLLAALPLLAAVNGAWIARVSPSDHNRANPYSCQPEAISAGKNLYVANCSRCHGAAGEGRGSRPAIVSQRIARTTDGDLAWLLRNGNIYKGMPSWSSIPEQQRWQIISYIRSLQLPQPSPGSAPFPGPNPAAIP